MSYPEPSRTPETASELSHGSGALLSPGPASPSAAGLEDLPLLSAGSTALQVQATVTGDQKPGESSTRL